MLHPGILSSISICTGFKTRRKKQPGVRDDVIEVRKTTSLFTPPDLMDFVS